MSHSPKLLGEGSFGCVFEPTVPCTSKIQRLAAPQGRREVGKVFTDKTDFRKEVRASKAAARVDPEGKTILVPTATCVTDRAHVMEHPAVQECEIISDFPYQSPKKVMYQLFMPYGGQRLDHTLKQHIAQTQRRMPLSSFLDILEPIMEGLMLLEKRGMCHQDLKASNVLVTPQGKAIMIDYSLMLPLQDVYASKNLRRLRHSYFPYPPEFKLAYFMLSEKECKDACSLADEVHKNIEQWGTDRSKRFYEYISRAQVKRAIQQFQRPTSKKQWKELASKVDVYGVGMMLVDVSKYLDVDGARASWRSFVKSLVHPDASRRATPTKAHADWQRLRNNLSDP
jgi:serine/threonine protein kinase